MINHNGRRLPPTLATRRDVARAAAAGVALVTLPLLPRPARAADDLVVFDWTGYEVPELHQEYIRKYGASPIVTMYADVHEAFQKINAGYRCDTVHPNAWDVRQFFDAGLLQPWDTSRLGHWPDVFPELAQTDGSVFDGQQYLIPTDWGINSIAYRTDLVEIEEESWNILWDERYAGRLSNNAEMDLAVLGASLTLGIADPFHATDEQFASIRDRLVEQRPLLRFYWSDPTELENAIASGEVVAAVAWPAVYSNLKAQGVPIAYMTPKEGVYSWITGFVRLKEAPGKEQNAYDYVDAWLAPETGKFLIEAYGYGHTNRKSFDLVSAAVLEEKGLGSPETVLGRAHATREFDPGLRDRLIEMYEEVKAGG
ncbi:MAG: ABC transporter substrate-binding protein [Alphaproteobacteria bacterium]